MRVKSNCPVCKKDIWIATGQIVYGCGDCRKQIKAHNKNYVKKHGFSPEISKVKTPEAD